MSGQIEKKKFPSFGGVQRTTSVDYLLPKDTQIEMTNLKVELGGPSPLRKKNLSKADIISDYPLLKEFEMIKEYTRTHVMDNKLLRFAFCDLDDRSKTINDQMEFDIIGA